MRQESVGEQPEAMRAPDAMGVGEYGVPADDLARLDRADAGFQSTGHDQEDDGTTLVDDEDPIEALFKSFDEAVARPTVLDKQRQNQSPEIPKQPAAHDREEENKEHQRWQDAEFHPMFHKLPRAEVVQLMRAEEASKAATALARPTPTYVPNWGTDAARIAGYEKDGLI